MIPKFRLWDKRFSEFVEDFFVSEAGKIYKKSTDTSYGVMGLLYQGKQVIKLF